MAINYQFFCLFLIVVLFIVFCTLLYLKNPYGKSLRKGFLWYLILTCGTLFTTVLVPLIVLLPQPPLTILTWIIYDFLISYIITIELPSWLQISKFDDKVVNLLEDVRSDLIKMRFVPIDQSLNKLKRVLADSCSTLKDESLNSLLNEFITVCERIHNREASLWELTLSEVTKSIEHARERSKHPFPKLIDILALSGLSILIAQFLKLLE